MDDDDDDDDDNYDFTLQFLHTLRTRKYSTWYMNYIIIPPFEVNRNNLD